MKKRRRKNWPALIRRRITGLRNAPTYSMELHGDERAVEVLRALLKEGGCKDFDPKFPAVSE